MTARGTKRGRGTKKGLEEETRLQARPQLPPWRLLEGPTMQIPVGAVAGQTAASRIEAAARAREPAHRQLQPALLRTERQSRGCEQTARRSPATGPRTWLVSRMGMLMDEIKPQSFHDKLDFK